jgi:hypothetical protein
MLKPRRALRRTVVISLLVLFALFSLGLAQKRTFNSNQQVIILASDRIITISLKMSDNRVITVSQYDGQMIRTGPKGGEMLGITPRILDNGSVTLDFSRITKIIRRNAVVGEAITSVGSMELNSDLPQYTPISLISTIQLMSILKEVNETRVGIYRLGQCPCCVTCDGEETCGMSVELSCGKCTCN